MIPNNNNVDPGAKALAHLSNLASFTGRVEAAQSFAASAADKAYQAANLQALADGLDTAANPAQFEGRRPDPELEQIEYLQRNDVKHGHIREAMAYKTAVDRAHADGYKPGPSSQSEDIGYG